MADTTQPEAAGPKGKDEKGGGLGPLKPTDVIPVWLDAATAKSLLLALSLSLGKSTHGKKKKKGGTGGTGTGGGGHGGGKGGGGNAAPKTAARTNPGTGQG
jgi:hypothetical protein